MLAQKAAALAEAVADLVDVLGQAGQEQPAGAGGEGLGMVAIRSGVSVSGSTVME